MQSLSIVAQKNLGKCEDTYLTNKYLRRIYEDSFGAMIVSLINKIKEGKVGSKFVTEIWF